MINKSKLKFYGSLKDRKARADSGLFIAEGHRAVQEGLKSNCSCEAAFVREGFFGENDETDRLLSNRTVEVLCEKDFRKLANTESPQGVLAVFDRRSLLAKFPSEENLIVLYDLADPRNMGTIIRSADWFGFREIVIGETCVDIFNEKVVRSTMGSIFHCRYILSADLAAELRALKPEYRVLTADTGGVDYRNRRRGGKTAVVFPNETRGPSDAILALSDERITIPGFGMAESLNVSCAAAIILASYR